MLSEELRKKVRQIEITTKRVIDDVMSGGYRSHFKGQGMQFSEHRVYIPGDEVRHIDWKAVARGLPMMTKRSGLSQRTPDITVRWLTKPVASSADRTRHSGWTS